MTASEELIGFGIDIGGSGIKGGPVNLKTGELTAPRVRIPTPFPSSPSNVAKTCQQLLNQFDLAADLPVGVAFPAPIVHGVVPFVANMDQSWAGCHLEEEFESVFGRKVVGLNDADAAGYAEVLYGAAKGVDGLVIVTTLGTGIGSALAWRGHLVPNSELGHLEIGGADAESRASGAAREREDLDWQDWATRLQTYFSHVEMLFNPDLFVVGGGVSRKHDKFLPLLDLRTRIVPAELRNAAGIVGAAARAFYMTNYSAASPAVELGF